MLYENFIKDPKIDSELYAFYSLNSVPQETQTEIAKRLGCSRKTLYNHLTYLKETRYLSSDNKPLINLPLPLSLLDYLNNPYIIKTYLILSQNPSYTIKNLCDSLNICYRTENRTYIQKNIDIITKLDLLKPINKANSFGESKLQELFYKYNLPFEKEKTFDDLISPQGAKYRYDFYLPAFNTLIEFDGEQHFNPNSNWDDPRERDKIKNEYAETHKIPLIRVPYTKENELENIILEIIAVNEELNAERIQKYKKMRY